MKKYVTYPLANGFGCDGAPWFCAKLPNVIPLSEEPSVSKSVFFGCSVVPNDEFVLMLANVPKPLFGLPNVGAAPNCGAAPNVGFAEAVIPKLFCGVVFPNES